MITLKGLLNSITCALSGLIVRGATIISALSVTSSPMSPVHSFFATKYCFYYNLSKKIWNINFLKNVSSNFQPVSFF